MSPTLLLPCDHFPNQCKIDLVGELEGSSLGLLLLLTLLLFTLSPSIGPLRLPGLGC